MFVADTPASWKPASTPQDLLDVWAIGQVLVAYCQGVDRKNWEQVLSCYHHDAFESHGQYVGDPVGFVEWLRFNHVHVVSSMHVLSNVAIQLSAHHDGYARVESYCLSNKTVTSASVDTFFNGGANEGRLRRTAAVRYVDTFEKRDPFGWRIRRRDVVFEWVRQEADDRYLELEGAMDNSRRDSDDLLYAPLDVSRP